MDDRGSSQGRKHFHGFAFGSCYTAVLHWDAVPGGTSLVLVEGRPLGEYLQYVE